MAINTTVKTLNLDTVAIKENIVKWIEQDIIVPDTKPDAIKIVNVEVKPYINQYEKLQGKIKVSGNINYFVIYKVDDENFCNRGLLCTYPFNELLDVSKCDIDMNLKILPICKNVIYSLPNERKISIKSEIMFKVTLNNVKEIPVITGFDSESNVECKNIKSEFCNIIETKKSIISSKEDFILPKDAEDFYEILNVDTRIVNTEFKESYNKIMVKGEIEIKMIYLTQSQDEKVKKLKYNLPFSAMIELANISDKSKFELDYIMQNFDIKLNQDITTTKTMNVDYQIEVNVKMYEREELEYVEDFYSQTKQLNFITNTVEAVRKNINLSNVIELKESISNAVNENCQIVDYKIDTSNVVLKNAVKSLKIQGEVKVLLLVEDMESLELSQKIIEIMVDENVEINDIVDEKYTFLDIVDENIELNQSGSNIDVKIKLKVNINMCDVSNINIIDNIMDEKLDESNLDSINIYVVKPEDNIWNIAKKYKTSIDKILRTNEINSFNEISVGQKILIIR